MIQTKSLSYKDAGVDIDAGNQLVANIKDAVQQTLRPEVIGGIGGFAALCALPNKYQEPILVSATDGVGTKLKLAIDYQQHHTIGIDLVAMSVNDLIVQGAEPLFFLDYFATNKLQVEVATSVITGIAQGCKLAKCALIGGETAEMPGIYHGQDYDLAGFCVGVVEKNKIITSDKVQPGDAIIALASSGPHSNGFSLIRKVLSLTNLDPLSYVLDNRLLLDHLLSPTKIYVSVILSALEKYDIHGMSHITGGGFWENIPRTLPPGMQAIIDENSWQWPAIFSWLQQNGNISRHEMYRTFNCGVGMIIILPAQQASSVIYHLTQMGETAWQLGFIESSPHLQQQVYIR